MLPADAEGAQQLSELLWNSVNCCQPCFYNADPTELSWWCQPNRTLAGVSEKCAKVFKLNTDRITMYVCVCVRTM